MNYLVLENENLVDGIYVYESNKARELIKQHDLRTGVNLSAIVYNQSRGNAQILKTSKDLLMASYQPLDLTMTKNPITLIVGLCRPQTVKKVLQLALCLGIEKILFATSRNSEKNYLNSGIWAPDQLQYEISLGMAQSGDYLAPEIKVLSSFDALIPEVMDNQRYANAAKYLGSIKKGIDSPARKNTDHTILSIGPEKGWTEQEEIKFIEAGFQPANYGIRMLRIEQAIAYGLGQVY